MRRVWMLACAALCAGAVIALSCVVSGFAPPTRTNERFTPFSPYMPLPSNTRPVPFLFVDLDKDKRASFGSQDLARAMMQAGLAVEPTDEDKKNLLPSP